VKCFAFIVAVVTQLALAPTAQAGCAIATGTTVAFGSYSPLTFAGKLTSADADSASSVTITCTGLAQATTYSLKLGGGSANDVLGRSMLSSAGGTAMRYNLFVDASRSLPWGDGITGATLQGTIATANGTASHTFYGRVPAGQHRLLPGTYADLPVLTLEYSP
jgi:spore coat protein U-like protein